MMDARTMSLAKLINEGIKKQGDIWSIYTVAEHLISNDVILSLGSDSAKIVRKCRDCEYNADNGGGCNRTLTFVTKAETSEYVGLEYCSFGKKKGVDNNDLCNG